MACRSSLVATFGFALLGLSPFASAANDATLNRLLRRDIIVPRASLGIAFTEVEASFQPSWEFDSGLSYTDLDGPGRAWEVPLTLAYQFTPLDSLKLTTGFIRDSDGTKQSSGADDFGIRYTHKFDLDGSAWSSSVALSVVAPSGGSVGSTTARQSVQAALGYNLSDDWSLKGVAAIIHINNTPTGIDNVGERYALIAGWKSASLTMYRDERSGKPGITTAEFEYDFNFSKILSGALVVDSGLTNQHRDNSLEFDLAFVF